MTLVQCCVPFCEAKRGLRKSDNGVLPSEWICATHWRQVPAKLKRDKHNAERFFKRAFARGEIPPHIPTFARKTWDACKAAAIEGAAGI